MQHNKPSLFNWLVFFRFFTRVIKRVTLFAGKTKLLYRAKGAFRFAASTNHRAHIHHSLVIFIGILCWRMLFGVLPKLVFNFFLPRPTFNRKAACQSALYVASKMAWGCLYTDDKIAAAVERPIPGSALSCSISVGNSPWYSAATILAALCKLRARRNSQVPSKDGELRLARHLPDRPR